MKEKHSCWARRRKGELGAKRRFRAGRFAQSRDEIGGERNMYGSILDKAVLHNGVQMPLLGYGSVFIEDPETIVQAIELGYRNIDTAADYDNEEVVGEAVRACGLRREEVFVTTKLWNSSHGYEKTLAAFEASRKRLGLSYVDLYLIHWPCPDYGLYVQTWKAMEHLYQEGVIRAIGVSNFYPEWLDRIAQECEVLPMVNQVECNPYNQNREVARYCREKGILMEAYTPLASGAVDRDAIIGEIARKYQKSCVQVTIRFLLQEGIALIPRTKHCDRMKSNADVFDFQLSGEDMERMRSLDRGRIYSGEDPRTFHELKNLKEQIAERQARERAQKEQR